MKIVIKGYWSIYNIKSNVYIFCKSSFTISCYFCFIVTEKPVRTLKRKIYPLSNWVYIEDDISRIEKWCLTTSISRNLNFFLAPSQEEWPLKSTPIDTYVLIGTEHMHAYVYARRNSSGNNFWLGAQKNHSLPTTPSEYIIYIVLWYDIFLYFIVKT